MNSIEKTDRRFRHRCGFVVICLLTVLTSAQPHPLYAQDQSTTTLVTEVTGTVVDPDGSPAAVALDFWLDETKVGSTTSADNGDFSAELTLTDATSDTVLRVSSELGHALLTVRDARSDSEIDIELEEASQKSSSPIWVKSFFATILPIIVCAIVFLAIRNRRRMNEID